MKNILSEDFFRASSDSGNDSDSGRSDSGNDSDSGRSDSGNDSNMLMLGGLEVGDLNRTITPLLRLLQHRKLYLSSNSLIYNTKP
jgi:hypothetical protein